MHGESFTNFLIWLEPRSSRYTTRTLPDREKHNKNKFCLAGKSQKKRKISLDDNKFQVNIKKNTHYQPQSTTVAAKLKCETHYNDEKTQNNSFPGEYEHLVPLPSVFVGVMLEPLTFRQTGWHRGWRACFPCPPRSEPCRRTSAGCSAWRTSVSPGWCPGGPGSPHTGRWCDRSPVDSSLDPCSPPGHLTRLKEAHAPSN